MRTHTIRRWLTAALLAGSVSAAAMSASAAVPVTITNQGRLFDADDGPINGSLTVTFAIYDAANAQTPLWSEEHKVDFDEGFYSVSLGSIVPFDKLFDGSVRYLGITIESDPELLPRAPIQSVPYALLANDVNGDIHPTSVTINGTEVINNNGEWVGPPTGLVGPTGPQGPDGPVGPAGATGALGPVGPMGPTGADGAVGPAGAMGPMGPTGAIGPAGPIGPMGPVGATGATGAVGPMGPMGPTGAMGPQGAVGPTGPVGPMGAQGATGPQGDVGPMGPTGAMGPQGVVGPTGPVGPMGAQGATGPQGDVGPMGPTGAMGPQGAVGPTGPVGPMGAQGATGPQGDVGPMGPTGAMGPQGAVGPTGPVGPMGAQGATGPAGAVGPTGATGAMGPQGPIGATGAVGPQGPIGATGAVGPQGPQGIQGVQGPVGPTGAVGPQGPIGATGAVGPQGPQGIQGVQGPVGPTGAQGPQGIQGVQGPVGPTGAQGPQGPAGSANINGTTNFIVKFTSATTGGNSRLFDDGTNVGLGTTAPNSPFHATSASTVRTLFAENTSTGGTAIVGINTAAANTGGGAGVYGMTNQSALAGVYGDNNNTSGTAIHGAGQNVGGFILVAGSGGSFTGQTTGTYSRNLSSGVAQAEYTDNFGDIVRVNFWDGLTNFKIQGIGTVSTTVQDPTDATGQRRVTLYAPEAPEVLFEDYGEAKLDHGFAHVELDPIFTSNVQVDERHPLRVFIQLEENDQTRGVVVKNKTATGFDVVELGGGTSNMPFQWHVVCNRADEITPSGRLSHYADLRFGIAPEPLASSPTRIDNPSTMGPSAAADPSHTWLQALLPLMRNGR
ncbi:hypothetical protein [Polyangium sp. 6x1]|uniref:hypothetical protein n=1 Tax=Polyangium sp. 6x1 TaxID=3042689 RepID=UPI0024831711|nr:hypothetical protein [Polyangium sp. 6x1]MDI1447593.1 hypothetical protein [Polyangium sp. 6x1]